MRQSITTSPILLFLFVGGVIWMFSMSSVLDMNSLQSTVQRRPTPQKSTIKSDEEASSTIRSSNKEEYQKVMFDNTRPSRLIWKTGEGQCASFKAQYAKRGTLPQTYLASYPGSGNTWTRFLIEAMTGIFTGSIYRNPGILKSGFLGEKDNPSCRCTIAIKTHRRFRSEAQVKPRALVLIRNPYDAIISFRNYKSSGQLGLTPSETFTERAWDGFVKGQISNWKGSTLNWLQFGSVVGVVHYELLKSNLTSELTHFVENLNLKLDPERLRCTVEDNEGKFHRKTPSDAYYKKKDPYSEAHHILMDAAIHAVNKELQKQNHRPLPLELYNYMEKEN